MVLADYRDIWEVGRIWTENSWHVHTLCEFFSVVGSFSDDNPVCYIYIYFLFVDDVMFSFFKQCECIVCRFDFALISILFT